jgi:hypothetical protein
MVRIEEASAGGAGLAWPALDAPAGVLVSEEDAMNAKKWIRQLHRWLAMTFTATVIITFVALAQAEPIVWVSYVPLFPLALLLLTGLYLFALPYASRWRSRRTAP